MSRAAPRWVERYVGLPFVDGGRDWSGVDCWGLIRLVLREEAGVEVPDYGAVAAADLLGVAKAMGTDAALPPWERVDGRTPQALDVACFYGRESVGRRRQSVVCHVGIMVDARCVLHVEKQTHAACLPLAHPAVAFRLESIYRHEALA